MSLPVNIKEWFEQFLRLIKLEGVDIKSPESANHFSFINLSECQRVYRGKKETEYRDAPTPISAPQESAEHVDDPLWISGNTVPIAQMSDEQITMLYNKAREGLVAYNFIDTLGKDPVRNQKIIYTGDDMLPHISRSTLELPLVESRDTKLTKEEDELVEKTFPNARNPKDMAVLAVRHAQASNYNQLGFAMNSEEIDKRMQSQMILSKLYDDMSRHPEYYKDPNNASARTKLIANGAFKSAFGKQLKVPKELEVENPIDLDITVGAEKRICSISTTGKTLDEMIEAGLILRENGKPYTPGQTPWDASNEIAKDLLAGKTVNVFRPGEKEDDPPVLDGALSFSVTNDIGTFKEIRTEKSRQEKEKADSEEKDFKGIQAHETVYGGLRVEEDQKKQLEEQPVGDILDFSRNDDGSYQMTYRMPEMLTTKSGKDVHYRETMNYIFKGMANMCFDADGNFDPSNFLKYEEETSMYSSDDKCTEEFANRFGIPKKLREDFYNIMRQGYDLSDTAEAHFSQSITDIRTFQSVLDENYKKNAEPDPAKEKFLKESYGDFQRRVSRIREMADMDPVKEKRFLSFMDCGFSSTWNNNVIPMVNKYREKKHLPPIDGKKKDIYIDQNKEHPDNPETGYFNSFGAHSVFLADVKLNGADLKLSVETTAPKCGKLMFAGEKGENALGLFRDEAELESFHRKGSYYHIDNFDAFAKIKAIDPDKQPKRTESAIHIGSNILETKMRLSADQTEHTYAELSKRLNSKEVDNRIKLSSPEFAVMRESFEALEKAPEGRERLKALARLNVATQIYLDYKEPKGDAKKAGKLSDYARRRLDFAHDLLEYTSVSLNKEKIKIPCVPEIRNNDMQMEALRTMAKAELEMKAELNREKPEVNKQNPEKEQPKKEISQPKKTAPSIVRK